MAFKAWGSARRGVLSALIAFAAGAIAGLGQAPFSLFLPGMLGLMLGFYLIARAESPREAAWLGWLLGIGYFALVLHWIVEPFLVDPVRHGWMAPFALIFMAGGLALFWGAAAGCAALLAQTPSGLARLLALPLFFALAELARGYVFTGFPWMLIGMMVLETPYLFLASAFGPYGLSFLLCLIISLLLPIRAALLARVVLLALIGLGLNQFMGDEQTHAQGSEQEKPVIRVIQPNAPQHLKWLPTHMWGFFDGALALSRAENQQEQPDLIVWPEVSIPPFLINARETLLEMTEAAEGVPIIAGIRRVDGYEYYNSAILIDAQGRAAAIYDKQHLVPFGEYVPFAELMARFGIFGLAAENNAGYRPGPENDAIHIPGMGVVQILICYESVFPRYSRWKSDAERPDFIINITNDAWFGNWAGPEQHLAHARFRAVESGLPVIRSANTGISAIISPEGEAWRIPHGQKDFIQRTLPESFASGLFSKYGNFPLFIVLSSICFILSVKRIFWDEGIES